MVTFEDTTYRFARLSPGQGHALGRARLPVLLAGGHVDLDEADGVRPLQVPVRRVLQQVGVLEDGAPIMALARAAGRPSLLFADSDYRLIVTDARIILVHDSADRDGSRIAGHIRYPWMQSIGFRPKQSFLNDAELVIEVVEDFAVDEFPRRSTGSFLHRFTLLFDKTFHPGGLALEIARRVAAYIATTQGVTDSVRLDELRAAEPLQDPAKGEHATYVIPVFCAYPEGVFGLAGESASTTWLP